MRLHERPSVMYLSDPCLAKVKKDSEAVALWTAESMAFVDGARVVDYLPGAGAIGFCFGEV